MLFLASAPGVAIEEDEPAARAARSGRVIRLTLPVTSETDRRVRRFVDRVMKDARSEGFRPVMIFELVVPPGQSEFGRGSQYGAALEVARFLSSDALNAATTVAYLPGSIQGHAVLVAMACDEIIMAPDAKIGSAGIDEKRIDDFLRAGYRNIAARRRTVPVELALGMLDPAREVLEVETEVSREFVSPEGLEELRKTRTIKSEEVLIPKGEAGEFTGTEARRLGFVSYLATSRRDAARALELPPEAVEEDLSLVESWNAVRVDLKGPIRADTANGVQRLIEEAIRDRGVNFVCLWIDSPGGSPVDSIRLANFLAKDLSPGKVRTVAYIPAQARSDAAIVALACDQVVMRPDAVLGGSGAHEFSQDEIERVRETIHKVLAPAKSRSWSLPAAMVDPNLEVFRYTRLGIVEYFSEAELAEQAAPQAEQGEWRQGERVSVPGAPFRTGGTAAVEYRLAARTVEDFAGLKQLYGLEHDPALVEPGWADFLIEALASPGVAWLLLMIGGAAIYAELHTPGIGIGGFIAAICFLLYFWSNHLGGTAGWLEILLFLAGISCLVFEVFVLPGFGIFGFGGGLLVLSSLVLASQTFIIPHNEYQFGRFQISLLVIGAAAVGVIVSAAMMNRWLPHAPILRRVMLNPLSDEEQQKLSRSESLVDFANFVGQEGIATTQLTPGGKARFGDKLMDVIADSELIERNTPIVIVEVHGNRVMVQAVE